MRPDTLNIDVTQLDALFSHRTRALVVVHYAGVGCEMGAVLDTARRHGVPVVEDNAQGLFGKYKGKQLGTFGDLAALSFHETKNFTCGEGGALVINDARFVERAEILREKGTDRSRFFRGQVDKYTWVDIGSSYLPSELQSAFLYGQLEAREAIQSKRRRLWSLYHEQLDSWAEANSVQLPTVPAQCEQPYHIFYLLLPSLADRQGLIAHLKEKGILSVFHYLPLHLSAMGTKFSGKPGDCPVTEDVSERLLRLPLYASLTEDELCEVIDTIREFSTSQRRS